MAKITPQCPISLLQRQPQVHLISFQDFLDGATRRAGTSSPSYRRRACWCGIIYWPLHAYSVKATRRDGTTAPPQPAFAGVTNNAGHVTIFSRSATTRQFVGLLCQQQPTQQVFALKREKCFLNSCCQKICRLRKIYVFLKSP